MSCVKTAEPIKMQFGMLSLECWVRWVQATCKVLHGNVDAPIGRGTFEHVLLIEKYCKV